MKARSLLIPLALAGGLFLAGCGGSSDPALAAPTVTTQDPAVVKAQADAREAKAEAKELKAKLKKEQVKREKAELAKLKAELAKAKREAAAPSKPNLTPCQSLKASGVPFSTAYFSWTEHGAPASWDADKDGIPCEQSYGEQYYTP
jgi:hypothetical protein